MAAVQCAMALGLLLSVYARVAGLGLWGWPIWIVATIAFLAFALPHRLVTVIGAMSILLLALHAFGRMALPNRPASN